MRKISKYNTEESSLYILLTIESYFMETFLKYYHYITKDQRQYLIKINYHLPSLEAYFQFDNYSVFSY